MSLILTKYPGPDDAGPADEILHAGAPRGITPSCIVAIIAFFA